MLKLLLLPLPLFTWAEEPSSSSQEALTTAIETFEHVTAMEQQTRLTELETRQTEIHARLTEIENEMTNRKSDATRRIELANEALALADGNEASATSK